MNTKSRILLFSISGLFLQGAWSFPWGAYLYNQDGLHAYEDKNYDKSIQHFKNGLEKNPHEKLLSNLGSAQYKSKKYEEALKTYKKALKQTKDEPQLGQVHYNMGNAWYRRGQHKGNPLENWPRAIESYEQAIEFNPEDKQARENLEFVKKKLEDLKQQMGQKNPNSNKQDKGKGNNQNQQGKQNKEDDKKGQPDKNQDKKDNQSKKNQKNQQQPKKNERPNRYSDQEVDNMLKWLENDEKRHRNQGHFQRNQKKPKNLENMSFDDLVDQFNSRGKKDW